MSGKQSGGGCGCLLLLLIPLAILGTTVNGCDSQSTDTTGSDTPISTSAPAPFVDPQLTVPHVTGLSVTKAVAALGSAGFDTDDIVIMSDSDGLSSDNFDNCQGDLANAPACDTLTVKSTDPSEGTQQDPSSALVTLTVNDPDATSYTAPPTDDPGDTATQPPATDGGGSSGGDVDVNPPGNGYVNGPGVNCGIHGCHAHVLPHFGFHL